MVDTLRPAERGYSEPAEPVWDTPAPRRIDEYENVDLVRRAPSGWPRWLQASVLMIGVVLVAVLGWLTLTAPLSRSLQPIAAPSVSVLAADGEVIARRGARISQPVDVTRLPPHVAQAFIAIEDRRFFRHLGIDPWGLARAMSRNLSAGALQQGGSTITQQLAKTSFTGGDRTAGRKVQEAFIALWLEAWLSKEEILSRYLSNVYFGDNVYGLRAAALHYFSVPPERLTREQSAMLAAVVNAPTRLAPTRNLDGARARARLVVQAMQEAGFMTGREAGAARPARLRLGTRDVTPSGTYFTDWVLGQESADPDDDSYGEREVRTTLERDLQRLAERSIRSAGLSRSQAALVAMRTDGRVVAMVGGRNYSQNAFNRATQARRQPGSTFKLFVYLAALRQGWQLDSAVSDTPLTIDNWRPENYGRRYQGEISLADAFATSSNVVAVRLSQRVGLPEVVRAARDLGVTGTLPATPSLPLGTAGISLLEMTAAYAAVAADSYPVRPRGLADQGNENFLQRMFANAAAPTRRDPAFANLRQLLSGVVTRGTGTAANLAVPTFGKTGTTQDYRDAVFIGFAGDLVVGVWIGNDDNSPLPGVTGGAAPARVWRSFMIGALGTRPAPARVRAPEVEDVPANVVEPSGNSAFGDQLIPSELPLSDQPLPLPSLPPIEGAPPPPPPGQQPEDETPVDDDDERASH